MKAAAEVETGLLSLSGPPEGAMKAAVLTLLAGARCAGKAGRCKDARRLFASYQKLGNPGSPKDFAFMVPECK